MRKFKFIYTIYHNGLWNCETLSTEISAKSYEEAKQELLKKINGKEFSLTQGEEIR